MKKYWELIKIMSVIILFLYLLWLTIMFTCEKKWDNLAQILVFSGVGIALSYLGIPEALLWKFKKVIKEFKKNGE